MTVEIVKYCKVCGGFIKQAPPTYHVPTDFAEELCGGDFCYQEETDYYVDRYGVGKGEE